MMTTVCLPQSSVKALVWNHRQSCTKLTRWHCVLCIKCDGWPEDTRDEYIKRPRSSGWPSADRITEALNQPCHMVPVGHYQSEAQHLEWRFSCSFAETKLMQSWSTVQHATFMIITNMIKSMLEQFHCEHENPDRGISTYHIKSLFLWDCEHNDPSMWKKKL